MNRVLTIAMTVVNWNVFLTSAKSLLGYSISDSFDTNNVKHELMKYMLALQEIKNDEILPSIKDSGSLLRHASVSLMCVLQERTLNELREEVDLAITSCDDVYAGHKLVVVSGNLLQWVVAIVNLTAVRLTIDLRQLGNDFKSELEKLGVQCR